ncbi:Gfo/Idh/MocA family oxidoreductase [bacterium]|nr:Gfo/Idh/MocA family oxidoreductase [bacterium]
MSKASRRSFLASTAAAGAALHLTAKSYSQVAGANGRIGVGFLGVGGRCQQHIDVILRMRELGKAVAPTAVCDVWDGQVVQGLIRGRGLYPSAERCGLRRDDAAHVTKDYRRVLEQRDVDVVCIATPDHWHARMAIDAMDAGKHVYMEKPMTRTIAEAIAVVDKAKQTNKVVTVGVQSMADPTWLAANEYVKAGNIGHVLQGQTSYYRNSSVGQWRYYPLTREMSPTTIDWNMWLGHQHRGVDGQPLGPTPAQTPFDRAVWAQWRCYWPFGGGMFTDLFVHQTTHLIAAMGVRFPARVTGGGGLYMEYDGRDVPDVATVVADYDEGCQVIISATMLNDVQLGEMVRGHLGTIKFQGGGDYIRGFEVYGQNVAGGPAKPKGAMGEEKPVHTYTNPKVAGAAAPGVEASATYALWDNFLSCCSARNRETLSTPELGAAAFATVNLGVRSYREGKVFFWDKEKRVPTEADSSWATRLEARSKKRDTPSQVIGWTGGDRGSRLTPPAYQRLEGPWVNGTDPAPAGN